MGQTNFPNKWISVGLFTQSHCLRARSLSLPHSVSLCHFDSVAWTRDKIFQSNVG